MVRRIYEKKVGGRQPVLTALTTGKHSATHGRAIIFQAGDDSWVAIGDTSDRYWYLRMMSRAPDEAICEAEITFKLVALNGSIQATTRRSKPAIKPTDPLFKKLVKIVNMRAKTELFEQREWTVTWRTDGN